MIPTPFDFYAMEQEGVITTTRSGLINRIKIEIKDFKETMRGINSTVVRNILSEYNLRVTDLTKAEIAEIEDVAGCRLN